ncbi:MAG: PAS domain S-box protein [Pyrinomonadaceae bacterium]
MELEKGNDESDGLREREQHQMLEALRVSEDRYRVVTDAASDAIISIDEHSVIQFANRATEKIFGYTAAELSGQPLTIIMPEYLRHLHQAGMKRYLETGTRHLSWEAIEVPGLRKSGREIPLEISFGEFIKDGQHFFTGIIRDVTERKRAERYLAAQHAATRVLAQSMTLAEAAPQILQAVGENLGWEVGALWSVDEQARVLRCVEFWHAPSIKAQEFGAISQHHTLARGKGLPGRVWQKAEPDWITDVTVDDNFSRTKAAAEEGLHGGFGFPVMLHGDVLGVIEFFSREVQPPDTELLNVMATVGSQIGQFIEHGRAASELQASERRYRSLVAATSQVVWRTDAEGRVEDMPDWRVLTGQTEEEVKGFGWLDALHPDDRERTASVWAEAVRTGTVCETEYRIRRRDGSYGYFAVRGVPITDADGRIREWVGVCTDISERVDAEQRILRLNVELERRVIERTAELEAANKELEAFSYSVSHDLRAPLRSIDGFSQVLLEDYAGHIDAAGQNYLHRVRAATQRMAQLIDDMLKLSRVSRGLMRRDEINLSALARETLEHLQKAQPERRVEIEIAEDIIARGDAQLVRIALENLLGNAWKFTGRRPSAKIEFGIKVGDVGERIFFVRDNGAGFDMAYANKLFGAFQRLHSIKEFEGTGIGLATVQRIINRHGGSIRAEGEIGRGATFYFTL